MPRPLILFLALSLFSATVHGQQADVGEFPPVKQALTKLREATRRNRKVHDDANAKAFAEAEKSLKAEADRLTKAGKPEEAVAVKKLAANLGAFNPAQTGALVFNGHKYKFFADGLDWEKATAKCKEHGGHLVVIDNEDEQKFVFDQLKQQVGHPFMWVGVVHLDGQPGQWQTVNGDPLPYQNWTDGEPEDDDCGAMALKFNGKWYDTPKTKTLPFICEWDD